VGEIMTNKRTKKMSIWKRIGTLGICALVATLVILGSANAAPSSLSPKEKLGQLIFFDSNLS
jgi:cytochrome c peroxidase